MKLEQRGGVKNDRQISIKGGSYFAKNGNCPISMAQNWNITYISMDIGHENSNANIILEGGKTEIVIMIAAGIANHRS